MLSHGDLLEKLDDVSVAEILEYALNTVHEHSVVVYMTHHSNHDVVMAFTKDMLYMMDQSIPTQERIDTALKRVQKSTPFAKPSITPPESKGKGNVGG